MNNQFKFWNMYLNLFNFSENCDKIEDEESECIYLCGNSLGLKPKAVDVYLSRQLDKWAKM